MNETQSQQLKFLLSENLRLKLDRASQKSGHSLAEEIRNRLEDSFEFETDPRTFELIQDLVLLAHEVKVDIGDNWHANERSRAVFAATIADQIQSYRARSEPFKKDTAPDASEAPETTIGRAIARAFRRAIRPTTRSEEGLEHRHHLRKIRKRLESNS